MKGPMTTQTLRGMVNSGAMHWRGDRSNGAFGINATDSTLSFENFVVAFGGLLGSPTVPTQAQMQSFANFQLQVMLPPNPIRNLDNSLTSAQQTGLGFFTGTRPSDGTLSSGHNCSGCHVMDPSQGLFGTSRDGAIDGFTQVLKVPHLRNLYQKVGMFGDPEVPFLNMNDSGNTGNQIRGFGFLHDGSVDSAFRFVHGNVFKPRIFIGFPILGTDNMRRNVEQFVLAFDSDLAPIVGQQVTLTSSNAANVGPRINLLIQRAGASFTSKQLGGAVTECDLVVKVVQGGRVKGFLYNPGSGSFNPDDGGPSVSDGTLRALAQTPGQEVTYTAVPPGSGWRIATSQ
jgi:hypothetical protein